jgi:hypothetical protein
LLLCFTALITKAQMGYDFSQYDIGVAAGINSLKGDLPQQVTTQSINFNFTYNPSPFTNLVFEAQMGKLRSGDANSADGLYSNNDFTSFIIRAQLQLGEIMDYSRSPFKNGLKNIYLSSGFGLVVSRITQINRTSLSDPTLTIPGVDRSNEPFIPFAVGYEFKIFNKYQQPSVRIDLGYQYNFVLSDNLDGFTSGSHFDAYTQIYIGIKFAVGGSIISYRKQIHY